MQDYINDFSNTHNTFHIEHRTFQNIFNMPSSHYHPHYEIYYQVAQERAYFIKDKTYIVNQGNLVLLPPNTIHKTFSPSECTTYERILLYFAPQFLDELFCSTPDELYASFIPEKCILPLNITSQKEILNLLHRIEKEYKNESNSDLYLQLLLSELLILINRQENPPLESHTLLLKTNEKFQKLSQIIDYINKNYHKELSLNSLANSFYMSAPYLSRLFTEGTGIHLTAYISYIRIQKAQELLIHSSLRITEISEQVGFQTSNHFGKVFREIVGTSPSSYRRDPTGLISPTVYRDTKDRNFSKKIPY